ncbi:DMT family transporter [Leptolyngbya sp. NK1-12]|uniref:DMT family transporter n=1 Tax=Leptolyngbya sp. NK1-12 TaxID=2547451 RepID=A0AA97AK07_9CYAN|nr:DMT family transporter [Leptolyngbya sp. NK1-12]WNZ27239.1 DMT family transporter [Leptolyngbya sp. NK1-12]
MTTVGCAVGVAVYILALEVIAPRHSALPLIAVQLVTMAVLGLTFSTSELIEQMAAIANQFNSLLYLSLIVTATPIWTQAVAQRWVAAHEAALLYTLEPIFASIFSFWFLGESFSWRGIIGAGLVLAATVFSQRRR